MKPNLKKDAYKARKKARRQAIDIAALKGTVEGLLIARYCELKLGK